MHKCKLIIYHFLHIKGSICFYLSVDLGLDLLYGPELVIDETNFFTIHKLSNFPVDEFTPDLN